MAKPRGCVGHEFVLRTGPSGGCHICYKQYQRDRAAARYQEAIRYLAEAKMIAGCRVCGYNLHPAALELDHIKPVANSTRTTKFNSSIASVDKYLSDPNIQVLCANCHRIKTHDQVNKYKFGET